MQLKNTSWNMNNCYLYKETKLHHPNIHAKCVNNSITKSQIEQLIIMMLQNITRFSLTPES